MHRSWDVGFKKPRIILLDARLISMPTLTPEKLGEDRGFESLGTVGNWSLTNPLKGSGTNFFPLSNALLNRQGSLTVQGDIIILYL